MSKLGVAMVKELCPICAKTEMDGGVVMNKILSKPMAKRVENLHNQVIGFSKEPCDKCKEYKAMGFVLIGVVETKTEDATNPYRSGNIWVVKQEVADNLFEGNAPKSGVAFIDIMVADQMELPGINFNA
jgi:hypothetical protein